MEVEYEVLNILEFNSTRKRMSVVVRAPDDRLLLYTKGADSVIYERLDAKHPLNAALRDVTLGHMEEYGSAGLRTLCLAYTELDRSFYDAWQERYIEAKTSLVDRDAKVCSCLVVGCCCGVFETRNNTTQRDTLPHTQTTPPPKNQQPKQKTQKKP